MGKNAERRCEITAGNEGRAGRHMNGVRGYDSKKLGDKIMFLASQNYKVGIDVQVACYKSTTICVYMNNTRAAL